MGATSSSAAVPVAQAPPHLLSMLPPTPAPLPGVRVVCPTCSALLIPPAAPRFRCPCGALLQLAPTPPPVARFAVTSRLEPVFNSPLDARLEAILAAMPPQETLFVRALLERLPRSHGVADAAAVEALQATLNRSMRGTPQSTLQLLPTWEWTGPSGGKDSAAACGGDAASGSSGGHIWACCICLATYERGETCRTLPVRRGCTSNNTQTSPPTHAPLVRPS